MRQEKWAFINERRKEEINEWRALCPLIQQNKKQKKSLPANKTTWEGNKLNTGGASGPMHIKYSSSPPKHMHPCVYGHKCTRNKWIGWCRHAMSPRPRARVRGANCTIRGKLGTGHEERSDKIYILKSINSLLRSTRVESGWRWRSGSGKRVTRGAVVAVLVRSGRFVFGLLFLLAFTRAVCVFTLAISFAVRTFGITFTWTAFWWFFSPSEWIHVRCLCDTFTTR